MSGRHDFLRRETNNSKPNSLHIDDLVLFDLADRSGEVGRQQREFRFAQSGFQNCLTVIELVVADGPGGVSDLVHDLDRWLALEFVTDESTGKNVAGIQGEVG